MAHSGSTEGNADVGPSRRLTPGDLFALSFLWFPINMFWTAMLSNLLPHRVQEIVGDAAKGQHLGQISIIGAIATTVIQLIVAPISDACASRWGRRHPFIFWGILINIAASIAFATVGSFPLLIASFFCIQLCLNVANGPYQALMPDNVPPAQQGVASTYMGMALLLGILCGALILFLMPFIGTLGIVLIISALLLIGMGVTLRRVPDAPAPVEERLALGPALARIFEFGFRENPDFYRLLSSRFFINLSYSTVVAFLLYYLQDAIGQTKEGATHLQIILLLIVTLSGLIGTLTAGASLKRYSKKTVVYACCAALIVSFFAFAFISTPVMCMALAFLFGAGWGAFQAVDWALAVNLLPAGGAARYMAIWHLCMTIPQIIAPVFGYIADPINRAYGHGLGWRAAMLSTVIYLVIGALCLRPVRERIVNEESTHPRDLTADAAVVPVV